MSWRLFATLVAVILAVSAWAARSMFLPGENPYPGSIEAGYAAMTRWIAMHPNPFGWNPLQYEGLPTHRLYLPGVHYMAAALAWIAGIDSAWAYRLVTAVFYLTAPATFGVMVWYFTRSKKWTLAAMAAIALLSPAYNISKAINNDRGRIQLPWQLQTHMKYGEGPHNVGLAMFPLAVIAVHRAATKYNRRSIAAAAIALAAVALINLVAAFALAYACFVLLASGCARRGFNLAPPLIAAALGYALASWWLTPSFVASISGSWAQDAHGFQLTGRQIIWLASLAFGIAVLRRVFRRDSGFYPCFLTMALAGYGTVSMVRYATGRDVIPESHRYAIEMEIFLILWVFEGARLLMTSPLRWGRPAGAMMEGAFVLWCLPDAWRFVRGPAERWRPIERSELNTFKVAQQLASLKPEGRVFNSGVLRFRWNAWFDLPQATGNFDTALTNRVPIDYQFQIVSGVASKPGEDGIDAVNQLVALGVEYVTVHGPESKEFYKDFRNANKFEGLLERVWSSGGDVIYRVPFRSLAHTMRLEELPYRKERKYLPPFVRALTDNERPLLRTKWEGPNRLVIEGDIPEGHLLIPLVSYEKGWRATQNGKELWIEDSWIRYLRVHAYPGKEQRIVLEYTGEPDQKYYAGISAGALLGCAGMLTRVRRLRLRHRRREEAESEETVPNTGIKI